jgi:hypothetical protein
MCSQAWIPEEIVADHSFKEVTTEILQAGANIEITLRIF